MKKTFKSAIEFLKRLFTLRIRKRRRFAPRDGVYVVMANSFLKNQVDNISMGGLAFNYEDHGFKLGKGSYQLKVIADKNVVLDRVPFRRISDFPVGEVLYPYRKIKRFSVQFESLTSAQKAQLRYFLQNNTIGRS
jgi:hypothetical protein